MLITPDFSTAVETNNDPIPAGTYKVRVEEVEQKTTKAGEPRLSWKLKIFGAEGELAKYNNWPVYHSTMLVGKGAGMLKSFYKAAMGSEPTGPFDATTLYGKELEVTLVQRVQPDGTPSPWPDIKAIKALH